MRLVSPMKRFRLVFVAPVGSDSLEFKRRLLPEEEKNTQKELTAALLASSQAAQPAAQPADHYFSAS